MADKQRQDEVVDLTQGATPADSLRATSSIPPGAVSPFQALVGQGEPPPEPEKEEGPTFPVVEKRASFAPKPSASPVLIVPIQRVDGSSSMPPAPVAEAAPKESPAPPSEPLPNDQPAHETAAAPAEAQEEHEEHEEDQIFDLSDEMVVAHPPSSDAAPPAVPVSTPPIPEVSAPPPPPTGASASPAVSAPPPPPTGTSVPAAPPTGAAPPVHTPDSLPAEPDEAFEARETVISSNSLKGRGRHEETDTVDVEASGEDDANALTRDLFGAPAEETDATKTETEADENIAVDVDTDEADAEEATRDDEEELDLEDAEEMPRSGPPAVPSGIKDGRKPVIRRRRKQSKEWWARIFNDDYVSTIPKATVRGDQRKVNYIEKSLALGSNALVLDLACGNGRHSVGMAKRGYRVVGIDLSLPMLAQAAELAQDERQNINFIHGDMRDLSFDKTFDAIFCMGTSFGYFDDETNMKVLQGVFRALKPGGSFLLETANRDHVVGQTPQLTWFEGNGSICMEETAFNFRTSRLVVTRQLIMDGGRQVQNDISIRLYSLHEIEKMLIKSGFELGVVSGHTATPGAFFGPDSVRIFVCAKRPR